MKMILQTVLWTLLFVEDISVYGLIKLLDHYLPSKVKKSIPEVGKINRTDSPL
jgi:hypothetical protein